MRGIERPVKAGLYLALGLVLHMLETALIPLGAVVPLPGVRIGLANLVGLVCLAMEGPVLAIWVTLGRILLGGIFTGVFFSLPFWMGFGGGLLAIMMMVLFRRLVPSFLSWVGLSVIGALCHNLGQLLILILSMPSVGLLAYLPWMVLLSVPSGILVGVVASRVIVGLEKLQYNGRPRRNKGEEP